MSACRIDPNGAVICDPPDLTCDPQYFVRVCDARAGCKCVSIVTEGPPPCQFTVSYPEGNPDAVTVTAPAAQCAGLELALAVLLAKLLR